MIISRVNVMFWEGVFCFFAFNLLDCFVYGYPDDSSVQGGHLNSSTRQCLWVNTCQCKVWSSVSNKYIHVHTCIYNNYYCYWYTHGDKWNLWLINQVTAFPFEQRVWLVFYNKHNVRWMEKETHTLSL